jgi:FecR protein/Glucodextranase, domain B
MAGTAPPRRQARFILGLVLILAALPLGYFVFLYQPPPPPPPPAEPAPPPVEVKAPEAPVEMPVKALTGAIEVRLADGTWSDLKPDMVLHASDSLRTKGSESAVITSDKVTMELYPGTEVSLQELSAHLSRLSLGSGMATVTVGRGTGHAIEVRARSSTAVARTKEGSFTMSNDGAGTVAVGTREGEVEFEGNGKVVIIRKGEQSVVRPGNEGPSKPMQIPSSLLRKVQWPDKRQNKREVIVQGEAEPGTRIEISGETFSPAPDGTFKRTVHLKEGTNEVKVTAVSVGGGKDEARQNVHVDTKPPNMIIKPLWDNQGGQTSPSPPP